MPYSILRSRYAMSADDGSEGSSAVDPAVPTDTTGAQNNTAMATTMITNGAAGCLVGAAASPRGQEGVWAAIGFVMGATLGEFGIVGVALAALWKKVG